MEEKPGFPPEWQFRRQKGPDQEETNKKKRSKALNDLHGSGMVPEGYQGTPIDYDNYGIPVVEESQPQPQMQPQMPSDPNQHINQTLFQGQGQPAPQNLAPPQGPPQQPPGFMPPPGGGMPPGGVPPSGGGGGVPPQQPPTGRPIRAVDLGPRREVINRDHPVVQKLLRGFGIETIKTHDVDIINKEIDVKMQFKMTEIPEDLSYWAISEAQNKAILQGDKSAAGWFELLCACAAVVAMDGTPLYQVFEVAALEDELEALSKDKYNVPIRMRKQTAMKLADLLWYDLSPIATKLTNFYEDKIAGKNKISSSYEEEEEAKLRYMCPLDECDVVEFLEPKVAENGVETPYFCKVHRVQLVKSVDLLKEQMNTPLD